jgi:hypothetical protein
MTRSKTAISAIVIAMFTSTGLAQAMDPIEELKACSKVTDQDARLACFDKLGERVLGEEAAENLPTQGEEVQPETATGAETVVMPLPDELGSSENVQYVGLITSCEKGHSGDWYFFFDNDQVWKDTNNRNLRFDECHFKATITKRAFGYKMQIEGSDRIIRVTRVR